MSTLQIGKTNYSANRGEKLTFYRLGMKDNQRELVVRIAPPIKDLAEKGFTSVYVKQHFGYSVSGKGDKRIPQTFNCIERKDKNKNIIQNCPECDEIALRKADVLAKEAKLKADGVSEDVIEAQLRPAKAWLKEHNLDKKWNYLAKNESGQWGFLAISHTCWERLQLEVKRLQGLGFDDPFGVEQGVWFRFARTGNTFNTVEDTPSAVVVNMGNGTFGIKTDTLTEADFAALESLPNLTGMGRKVTYEQISMLVQSGGDEDVVKSVFQSSTRSETSPMPITQPTRSVQVPSTAVAAITKPTPVAAPTPQPAAAPPQAAPQAPSPQAALLEQMAALQAQLAALKAAPQAAPQVAAPARPGTPSPSLTKQLDLDVDDFVAQFGTPDENA